MKGNNASSDIDYKNFFIHPTMPHPNALVDYLFYRAAYAGAANYSFDFFRVNADEPGKHFIVKIEKESSKEQNEISLLWHDSKSWEISCVGSQISSVVTDEVIKILETVYLL